MVLVSARCGRVSESTACGSRMKLTSDDSLSFALTLVKEVPWEGGHLPCLLWEEEGASTFEQQTSAFALAPPNPTRVLTWTASVARVDLLKSGGKRF